jgi:SEC-C motif
MIQVSDRRLSWNGNVVEDESSKAGILTCSNARLGFGFTGLARNGEFRTRDWLLQTLLSSGSPQSSAREILERLRLQASETFRLHPALRAFDRNHKRLSSGYLYHHTPPLAGWAVITNYQNFQSGQDEAEAWDEFRLDLMAERRPCNGEPTLVQRVGNWRAMTAADTAALRSMLQDRKPSGAIIGKAVQLVRQMADRPAANNTIGKQLSVLTIPRDAALGVTSGYYSMIEGYTSYLHDSVLLTPTGAWAMKDTFLRKVRQPQSSPLVIPKVGRNHPCPCGSGVKYKRCHGRDLPARAIPSPRS